MNTQKKYTILILIFLGIAFGGIFAGKTVSSEKKVKVLGNIYNAKVEDIDYSAQTAMAWIEVNGEDRIYTWGGNYSGELGINSTFQGGISTPQLAYTAPTGWYIVEMDTSISESLIWVTDGTTDEFYTWGYNVAGELGYYGGAGVNSLKPTKMNTTGIQGNIDDVVFGQFNTYMISSDATNQYLYSYGYNGYGLLMTDTSDGLIHSAPTLARTFPKSSGYTISNIDGQNQRTVMSIDGPNDASILYYAGLTPSGAAVTIPVTQVYATSPGTHITDISVGNDSYGFITQTDDGVTSQIYTIGRNFQGVLGLGQPIDYIATTPQLVMTTNNQLFNLDVDYADMTVLEKSSTQTIYWGWGGNSAGQLGLTGTNQYYTLPMRLMTLDRSMQDIYITGIGVSNNAYVIENYGASPEESSQQVYLTGENNLGQLGTGTMTTGAKAGDQAILFATARAIDYPAVANSALIIDQTSITTTSFEFTMQVVDPDNVFDPNAMQLFSNGTLLTTTFIGETSTDNFTYKATELNPATTYDNFSVKLLTNSVSEKTVTGSVTTDTPTGITLNAITVDSALTDKTSVTFDIDASLNDYQNADVQTANYTIKNLTTGEITTGTSNVAVGPDSILEFTVANLDPGNAYLITSISLNYKDYTGAIISTDAVNDTGAGITFETLALDAIVLNNITLDSASLTDTSAQFIVDLTLGDYAFADITGVQYTLTDSFTGISTVYTTNLLTDGVNYYFMVGNLDSANYYSISNISLIYPDNNGVQQESNAWGTEPTEQVLFNTNVNQGVIDSVEFIDNTNSTIDFIVTYSDLGSFNPEDLLVSYSIAGVPITEPISPRLIQEVSPGVFQYRLENLQSGTIYSDFKFFLPYDVSSNNTNMYNYSYSTFETFEEMPTEMDPTKPTNVDYQQGLTPTKRGVGFADFSISFINMSVAPQYIQASYSLDGETVYPTKTNVTLKYISSDGNNVYTFRLIGLDRNKDYSDLKLYAPVEMVDEGSGNYEPGYNNFQDYMFTYDGIISTKTLSNLEIILIAFLALVFLLVVVAGIYVSVYYYRY